MSDYQFVSWFPEWIGFGFRRFREGETDLFYVYEWSLWFGWFIIRKWASRQRILDRVARDAPTEPQP